MEKDQSNININVYQRHVSLNISKAIKISPLEYASFWQMNGPTETCNDYELVPVDKCTNMVRAHTSSQVAEP